MVVWRRLAYDKEIGTTDDGQLQINILLIAWSEVGQYRTFSSKICSGYHMSDWAIQLSDMNNDAPSVLADGISQMGNICDCGICPANICSNSKEEMEGKPTLQRYLTPCRLRP